MNGIQSAIHLIDRATPQQLVGMVGDPSNPYRAIALAKLQEFRDMKMKAAASAPTAPPLAQTIPAQVMAPAQPQMPPQMAQMAPQMPPQMPQQPLDQGIGGIGPTVSAAAGGEIKRFAGSGGVDDGEATSTAGDTFRALTGLNTEAQAKAAAEQLRLNQNRFGPDWENKRQALIAAQEKAAKAKPGWFESLTPTQRKLREAESLKLSNEAAALVPAPAVAPAAVLSAVRPVLPDFLTATDPHVAASATPATGAPAALSPAARVGAGVGIGSIKPDLDAYEKGMDATRDAKKGTVTAIQSLINSQDPTKKAAEFVAAQQTPEQANAMRKEAYERLQKELPDPSKRIQEQLDALKGENTKDAANAPYQGLLKMGLAMLGTKNSNFLQALGEGGASGLTEYNSLTSAIKSRKTALLTADASLAQAQEARSRGLYDKADTLTARAGEQKMKAFEYKQSVELNAGKLAIELAGAQSGVAETDVAKAKGMFEMRQAQIANELRSAQIGASYASVEAQLKSIEASNKPALAKELEWLAKNQHLIPKYNDMQDQAAFDKAVHDQIAGLHSARERAMQNDQNAENHPRFSVATAIANAKQIVAHRPRHTQSTNAVPGTILPILPK